MEDTDFLSGTTTNAIEIHTPKNNFYVQIY